MADKIQGITAEPELTKRAVEPKGVLQKNLKPMLYLGAALLVIVAAIFSGTGKKTPTQKSGTPNQPPSPLSRTRRTITCRTSRTRLPQRNRRRRSSPRTRRTLHLPMRHSRSRPWHRHTAQRASPSLVFQAKPCAQGQQQPSPAAQEEQQLAAKDRELAYDSRFASNLVFARAPDPPQQPQITQATTQASPGQATSSFVPPRAPGDPPAAPAAQAAAERRPEVNIDAAMGQPYVIYEGTTLDTVLMNRLDGDAAGPVKVLVSNPIYSHDRQHVLIPEGTIVLGEAKKIGASGLGQQRRMAVVFHRLIMPDGYSVDLDQFHGLDQIGEEGLKDKVNNHYLEIFGTSIALGVIAGAGEIEEGGGTITTSGSQAFTTGAASSVSQSATTILDRFMQIPPTITIREGHRVKVYFTQDMLLPANENHTIPQTY